MDTGKHIFLVQLVSGVKAKQMLGILGGNEVSNYTLTYLCYYFFEKRDH